MWPTQDLKVLNVNALKKNIEYSDNEPGYRFRLHFLILTSQSAQQK